MAKAHPGFQAVQAKIAKRQGISKERAGAILAASTRRASPAAKKANPNLKHVKGNTGTLHTPQYPEFKKHTDMINSHAKGMCHDTDRDND